MSSPLAKERLRALWFWDVKYPFNCGWRVTLDYSGSPWATPWTNRSNNHNKLHLKMRLMRGLNLETVFSSLLMMMIQMLNSITCLWVKSSFYRCICVVSVAFTSQLRAPCRKHAHPGSTQRCSPILRRGVVWGVASIWKNALFIFSTVGHNNPQSVQSLD